VTQPIRKVLVANRGEIALRVIRACRELGIRTVAVYSTVDEDALHVRFADEALCVGSGAASDSYLNVRNLIAAAELAGADAVHPGYGFLSERADFAEVCGKCGLNFIGPSPEHMQLMGNKVRARETMQAAGVPVLPGTGVLSGVDEAIAAAKDIGLPVILKAAAGGGGRGMKIVRELDRLPVTVETAQAEAQAAFGDGSIYVERYVESPRHIEVQVIADKHGHVVDLLERECSVQRRHQKVIEEAPAANLPEDLRRRIRAAGVLAAKSIGYWSVGTIEMLLDGDQFYFMEMNTRIQVEHCVTEMITGVDLVAQQLRIARGEPLPFKQSDVRFFGHAIECRINAESPQHGFRPCPGRITHWEPPKGAGVRLDTHCYAGYFVPPFYDSLLAKLIVHGGDRTEAAARTKQALASFQIEGIDTGIPFLQAVIEDSDYINGKVNTRWLEKKLEQYSATLC
jgi:acetyl-CoA carboxylase biotin carboxylase subunit